MEDLENLEIGKHKQGWNMLCWKLREAAKTTPFGGYRHEEHDIKLVSHALSLVSGCVLPTFGLTTQVIASVQSPVKLVSFALSSRIRV